MRAFTKPALDERGQLALLEDRGLQIQDRVRATRLLGAVTLFRLTPYMRPFQHANDPTHAFHRGTRLTQIVDIYRFDSLLRQHVMAALERVEVAVRAALSNHMATEYGAHWYTNTQCFNRKYDHPRLVAEISNLLQVERHKFEQEKRLIERSRAPDHIKQRRIDNRMRDNYMRYYAETYNDPAFPPSWAMVEELSLGSISHLYKGLGRDRDRKAIAERFGLPQHVLQSWLHTLTFVRNICAHHSRLWNRELAVSPAWPDVLGAYGQDANRRRFFTLSMMLVYLLEHIGPDANWLPKLGELMAGYPQIPMRAMGFPADWEQRLRTIQQHTGTLA
ncbi:MAG: Abi family protein [Pseudomonadota bacterium]|nr:Abi family protein [Pseudomonadota bacterium]